MSVNLLDFAAPTYTMTVRGKELTIRGLCTEDLMTLVTRHLDSIEKATNIFENMTENSAGGDMMGAIARFSREVPELVQNALALALNAPDQAEHIAKWSIGLQTEVATQVARLTFEDAGGFAAFLGNVGAVIGNVKAGSKAKAKPIAASTGM
jgi:hypothetical protein